MKRYEQCTRVITAFYAVILGFGLKNLVDGKLVGEQHWLLLIIASLFFLRFLTGSANHLWVEYVRGEPTRICEIWFLVDICLLMLFGVIGLFICYADTIEAFLLRNVALGVVATIGAAIYWTRNSTGGAATQTWGSFWTPINAAQTILTLEALFLLQASTPSQGPSPYVGLILVGLAVVYFAALLLDLYFQLQMLSDVEK